MSSQAPSSNIKFSTVKSLMSGNTSGPIAQSTFRNFNPQAGSSGTPISIANKIANKFPFPPFNSNASTMAVCFSTRIIVPTYTGPVFRLRRSSDNAIQDFYTDKTQSYLTTSTGTSFSSWIGTGNTAYVTIWYDQSGRGNNASNLLNNSTQPYLDNTAPNSNGKYTIRFVRSNSTVLYIASGIQPNTVFCHFYNMQADYGATILSTEYDYQVRFSFGCTTISGDRNGGDWFFNGTVDPNSYNYDNDTYTSYSPDQYLEYNNGVNQDYLSGYSDSILRNAWNVLTLSVVTPAWSTSQTNNSTTSFSRIGQDGYDATGRSIDGWICELICHNKMITLDDINCYYNNRFF